MRIAGFKGEFMIMLDDSLTATVLMAVYNDEIFIEQALESVIQQLTDDIELLIIDDCSSDNSVEVLQNFADKDSRIRLIRNDKNQGLGYCLSIGTEKAKGKYVIRMDSDDICLPDRFTKQISFLEKNLPLISLAAQQSKLMNIITKVF